MKVFNALLAVAALSAGAAMANEHKAPNCEIKGKPSVVKDEAACSKKKGKWLGSEAPAAAPVAAPAPAAAPAPQH